MSTYRPRLREARQKAGLTQQEVADALGVVRPVVARWEAGGREPGVRVAVRMARILGTTADQVWVPEEDNTK